MSGILAVMPDGRGVAPGGRAGAVAVRLYLLRGFELCCDGRAVPLVPGSQRLLAFLAPHDRRQLRTYVAETLWPDVPDRRAWGNLRSALWRLSEYRDRVVEQAGDHLQLCPAVIVDVREADRLAALLIGGGGAGPPLDQRAFQGELLPGWFDEWILSERERHRQLGLHALELLCEQLTVEGRYCQAVQAGLAATNAEPLRESAHRILIAAHLAEGNASDALATWDARLSQGAAAAKTAIADLSGAVSAFSNNPARKLISLFAGAILGIVLAALTHVDLFRASGIADTQLGPFQWGVAITGVVMGLGSNPAHELINAITQFKIRQRQAVPGQAS